MTNLENATILTERTEMAKALNFGKNKVFKLNIDTMTGDTAVIEKQTVNNNTLRIAGTLKSGYSDKLDNVLYFQNSCTMISKSLSVNDWVNFANNAQAQTLEEGDNVAVLYYSELAGVAFVRLMEAGKPTPDYSTILKLEDI